ncbi:CAP domain-containing protein [Sphingomonas sp. KR1UV-12]|uniref:CAP domain-containing protein n=1 Tax=Sphingomonas aurea TaxID=3063994 RepID=A0ABT9ELY4_9SPHN|nr:CAP domain-containing protein [Sphingomonas sp. KR1UV-12]MDP1027832.1 CAP domain-containing protein [Sphingomonas sp. KR1UV-12]
MRGGRSTLWLARVAMLALSPLVIGATGLTSNLEGRLLAGHNRERAVVGVPPLHWDAGLASDAKRWADHLAASGAFRHSPDDPGNPQGENLWAGTRNAFAVESMVGAWARERRFFKAGTFPDNSVTGRVADVDHYTQMMWRRTNAVGCAVAEGADEDILVCRYSQAGNYTGERPF